MIYRLQDIFIDLFRPWIPIMGKLSEKIKYRVITLCFIVDLVLFCIVRYGLHKESYFYNTTCGILLMLVIAVFSLDRSLVRIHWRRSDEYCLVRYVPGLYGVRSYCSQEGMWTGYNSGICFYGSLFCVAESHEERSFMEVL